MLSLPNQICRFNFIRCPDLINFWCDFKELYSIQYNLLSSYSEKFKLIKKILVIYAVMNLSHGSLN